MITNIELLQTNISSTSDVISIHNPIVFIIEATYTDTTPEELDVTIFGLNNVTDDFDELGVYSCMPYADIDSTHRQFVFVANTILRGYMSSFDDVFTNENVIQYVNGMTRDFRLEFYSSDYSISFTALHATRQFGENQNLIDVYSNQTNNTYYAAVGMPVYVYYYNYDENNIINDNAEFEYWADTDGILFEEGNSLMISL